MTDRIIEQIATWNYVRDNKEFKAKAEYKMLIEEIEEFYFSKDMSNTAKELADIIFVAVGSLYKLTGTPSKTKEIIDIVIKHNSNKGLEKDENGKIKKVKQPPCEPEIKKVLEAKVWEQRSLFEN